MPVIDDHARAMATPGFKSCKRLANALQSRFGGSIQLDDLNSECDAFGWRMNSCPRLLFSVSTHAGALPSDTFDLQVSIIDESLENGEILFGPESPYLNIGEVCSIAEQFQTGEAES